MWSIICKKALIDGETNVISLFEILEKLTITQTLPQLNLDIPGEFVMPLDFEIVTSISELPDENKRIFLKIELFNAYNEKMGETGTELIMPLGTKTLRSRVVFNAIKIKGEGIYSFSINIREGEKGNFEEVSKIPLEVEILKTKQ